MSVFGRSVSRVQLGVGAFRIWMAGTSRVMSFLSASSENDK